VRLLALRDEFVSRPFDGPDAWWPDTPFVIGGRDRQAGGTWCASEVRTGATAVVLNRPDRMLAEPGASSRGVLPLLALRHGTDWPSFVDVAPMASFNLLLADRDALTWWSFDGTALHREELAPGTHLLKPRGRVTDPLAPELDDPQQWPTAVKDAEPRPDPSALLVRMPRGDDLYATVFGQLITGEPGALQVHYSYEPHDADSWRTQSWTVDQDVLRTGVRR
jgi:hypothetical protein